VFPEIQQEVVLLLADGKRQSSFDACDIHTIEFQNGCELVTLNNLDDAVAHTPAKHSRPGMKWTSLFLDDASYAALDRATTVPNLTPLGRWAEVDVGIVTGRNAFFVVSSQQRIDLQATAFTVPIVGRTSALRTTRFGQAEFSDYSTRHPSYLLNLNGVSDDLLPPDIQDYIKSGEREGVHLGYKCRVRKRWFDVPSIYLPDAFLFRQIHKYPLMVVNEAQATSTDTIHRVRLKPGVDSKLLATALFNSLTLAWAEVCGRSYGGGVLELEPAEAEELLVCYETDLKLDTEKVENLLRMDRPYEALDYVDKVALQDSCGMDQSTITQLRAAWIALRDRRINRK
jgi:adenine-specific DNA methylase